MNNKSCIYQHVKLDTSFLKMHHGIILFIILALLAIPFSYAQDGGSSVFFVNRGKKQEWLSFPSKQDVLYQIISNAAFEQLENRKERISSLNTRSDWQKYQKEINQKLCASLSKFKKTPLNPKITGTLVRDDVTIQKIIYESHPNFHVTASLFLPAKRQHPAPAIIYCAGHSELGFRSETYQHVILNLVEKGFIVLAYDPVGQGERLQYPDLESGKSIIGSSTQEHAYAGVQTLLAGSSLCDYFIWDGIRAVDYLFTREEVDRDRIGITGRSGGGTQSAMIAACDDRILAAAPENYVTNFKRLFQAIGPQDAEQNPWFGIARGIDHADFIHARAPKPTLIISTTHDYFSIQGTRETFSEVKKSYAAFGLPENMSMVEDYGGHESTLENRKAMYAFFQKFLNMPGNNEDIETEPFPAASLWSTNTGQVGSSKKGETVSSLNKTYFQRRQIPDNQIRQQIAHLAGIRFDRNLTSSVFTGKVPSDEIVVEKYFLENQLEDYVLPVYAGRMESVDPDKILVWLKPEGNAEFLQCKLIKTMIKQGYIVISADLPGWGELNNPDYTGDSTIGQTRFNYLFGANLVGKSIAGIQAEAIDLLIQFIQTDIRFKSMKIFALVEGNASAAFLHYTAFKQPFEKSLLITDLPSEKELVDEAIYVPELAFYVIPGSLPYYQPSDLLQFHRKETYKIILEKHKELPEIVNTEIISFLQPEM
ncbi:MAG: acetylxylan esterase [Proteiniphilum sp.]|nr:acetylxylan esterase [Proteiniphilum sp.]